MNERLKKLYEKHHVLTDGLRRLYVVGLNDRRLDMESSSPDTLYVVFDKEGKKYHPMQSSFGIKCGSWSRIIGELVRELLQRTNYPREALYHFSVDWSDAVIFSSKKVLTNMIEVDEGLYVNIGYTANHLLWLIQDILKEFDVKNMILLIHRPPFSEPIDITNEIIMFRREEFVNFLMINHNKDEEHANKIAKGIDTINSVLAKTNTVYNNFYQFDAYNQVLNYKSMFLKKYHIYINWNNKQVQVVEKYLSYISEFFKLLDKEAKKHPIESIY